MNFSDPYKMKYMTLISVRTYTFVNTALETKSVRLIGKQLKQTEILEPSV
jgi:hypothetical protein